MVGVVASLVFIAVIIVLAPLVEVGWVVVVARAARWSTVTAGGALVSCL